jgi:hypothetical protein
MQQSPLRIPRQKSLAFSVCVASHLSKFRSHEPQEKKALQNFAPEANRNGTNFSHNKEISVYQAMS